MLTVIHEGRRSRARRGSAPSVVIISHTSHLEERVVDGFDVIGRGLAASETNLAHYDDTESVSSAEFMYVPNLYSDPRMRSATPTLGGRGTTTPPPSPRARDEGTTDQRGRRRSSLSDLLIPVAMVAAHVAAVGLILMKE